MLVSVSMNRTLALPIIFMWLTGAAATRGVHAQRPERQHEVRLPGTDVVLQAGWQLLIYDGCMFAVPETWRPNAKATFVSAPDGSSISVARLPIQSWSAHKAHVRDAVTQVKVVHEDSAVRLWLESRDDKGTQHYVDVANGPSVCTGFLDIRNATTLDPADTASRIAKSIGAAPVRWP